MKKSFFLLYITLFISVFLTGCIEDTQSKSLTVGKAKYMVLDLLDGKIYYMNFAPFGGWSKEYKTTKLVLRRINPGTFVMGSPEKEAGRSVGESQHKVTISKPFYIGIFEITQKQYQLIVGNSFAPCSNLVGDTLPIHSITYNDIRGSQKGGKWPTSNEVDEDSFLGKLRAKWHKDFDLPTEAQWEYACRAGTTKAINSGDNLKDERQDPNLNKLGKYGDGVTCFGLQGPVSVGSYKPNRWGIYDMHGNVEEWCLDWHSYYPSGSVTDPLGPDTGDCRVIRGGNCGDAARDCRSAARSGRYNGPPSNYLRPPYYPRGFRVVLVQ